MGFKKPTSSNNEIPSHSDRPSIIIAPDQDHGINKSILFIKCQDDSGLFDDFDYAQAKEMGLISQEQLDKLRDMPIKLYGSIDDFKNTSLEYVDNDGNVTEPYLKITFPYQGRDIAHISSEENVGVGMIPCGENTKQTIVYTLNKHGQIDVLFPQAINVPYDYAEDFYPTFKNKYDAADAIAERMATNDTSHKDKDKHNTTYYREYYRDLIITELLR